MYAFCIKMYEFFEHAELLPAIDIGHRSGRTDYIDFIKSSDFPDDTKVVKGMDVFRRGFISVKHDTGVFTFFSRYTNNPGYCTCGGHLPEGIYFSGGINLEREKSRQCDLVDFIRDTTKKHASTVLFSMCQDIMGEKVIDDLLRLIVSFIV